MPESRKATMICSSIGLRQISTIGLGRDAVNSFIRVPFPAAKITAFIGSQIHLLQTLRLRPSGPSGGLPPTSRWLSFLLRAMPSLALNCRQIRIICQHCTGSIAIGFSQGTGLSLLAASIVSKPVLLDRQHQSPNDPTTRHCRGRPLESCGALEIHEGAPGFLPSTGYELPPEGRLDGGDHSLFSNVAASDESPTNFPRPDSVSRTTARSWQRKQASLKSRCSRSLRRSPQKCHRPAPWFWQEDFL
jgi:hypothetical protein